MCIVATTIMKLLHCNKDTCDINNFNYTSFLKIKFHIDIAVLLYIVFRLYKAGIWQSKKCNPHKPVHALVVVGYNESYWILKNR